MALFDFCEKCYPKLCGCKTNKGKSMNEYTANMALAAKHEPKYETLAVRDTNPINIFRGTSMKIALYDMADGGIFWSDIDAFVNRTSVEWLAHCLSFKWAWDLSGSEGLNSDGPCVFIQWAV